MLAFCITSWNLNYVTEVSSKSFFCMVHSFFNISVQGKGRSAKEILKRIDYFGSLTLMLAVRFHILSFYIPFEI